MAPTIKRKAAQKAKSKLLGTSTLLDNEKLSEFRPSSTSNQNLSLNTRPKRTASVNSLLENAPVCVKQAVDGKWKAKGQRKKKEERSKKEEKERERSPVDDRITGIADDALWTDRYAPQSESELAIHKKKVDEVRHWLEEAFEGGANGTLQRFRRILALTGPAGSGKSATLKALATEFQFDIVEWQNTADDRFAGDGEDYDYESLSSKFQNFLNRASSCRALDIFSPPNSESQSTSNPAASQPSHCPKRRRRQVIVLEDLPNILHPETAMAFHSALEDFVSLDNGIPLVCIISNSGLRGEDPESGVSIRDRSKRVKHVVDVRSVIPPSVFNSIYFREIRFNPVAPTLMTKALTAVIAKHFDGSLVSSNLTNKSSKKPGKEIVQLLVETSGGDIRSAIMSLQFACLVQFPNNLKNGDKGNSNARAFFEGISRREQSLVLFHLLGKVLYNKRKGDPASSSFTIKEREKHEEEDRRIKDPPTLPDYLSGQHRRASRVDVNALYADSPIDSSLFALYLHQNYTQFCDDIDQCDAIAEQLSWTDSVFPEFIQSIHAPYQFHILALNTLHYLPSPVPRLSQKLYKPAFFENLRELREAEGAAADVVGWLNGSIDLDGEVIDYGGSGRKWTMEEVVLELGGLLSVHGRANDGSPSLPIPPQAHTKFSSLMFIHPSRMSNPKMERLEEGEDTTETTQGNPLFFPVQFRSKQSMKVDSKGWLESDDITEFEEKK